MSRLPNLFIVGVTKAGTTSLYTYLNAHPDFCGSVVKETQYFKPKFFKEENVDFDQYKKFFVNAGSEKYVFEASPIYINGGQRLASYLKAAFPGCRIVILLRDPVDRVRSFFNHCKDLLLIEKDMPFRDYLDECERQMALQPIPEAEQWQALARRYTDTLGAWIDVFGPDLYIGFFEDLKRDAGGVTDDICRWLGVKPATEVGVRFTVENATIRPANTSLHRLAMNVNRLLEPVLRRNNRLKKIIRDLYHGVNKSREAGQAPTEADIARLRALFEPSNRDLLALLRDTRPGLRLPSWLLAAEGSAADAA